MDILPHAEVAVTLASTAMDDEEDTSQSEAIQPRCHRNYTWVMGSLSRSFLRPYNRLSVRVMRDALYDCDYVDMAFLV